MESTANKNVCHILVGGTIGNLTEWYNFLLYGYLASVISQLFFPSQNQLLSLTLVFTVFALSFLARPLGGLLFGWIGDVYGRQRALVLSLIMMGVPTFLIGCLPTYDSIGLASPILLSLLRIMQGLSAGGEHTGSAIYIAEHAPPRSRALWVSTVPASAALGILISSLMALLIVNSFAPETLLAWGWRVGYWIGTGLCVVSLLLRLGLPETPYFEMMHKRKRKERLPLSELVRQKETRNSLLLVFILASCWGVFYQILFIWMPTYLSHFQHWNHGLTLQINSLFLFFFICLIVIMGYFADHVNRKRLLLVATTLLLLLSYPIFMLLSSGFPWQVYVAMGLFSVTFSLYLPVTLITMLELFPAEVRYTGLSLGFNTGLALFGGTCPLVVTWLIEITGMTTAPAFYMMLAAFVALVTCQLGIAKASSSTPLQAVEENGLI